jgi:hypothetical protein
MSHRRQGADVVHDPIRGRYFRDTKAQQQQFRDDLRADPNAHRGVTVTHGGPAHVIKGSGPARIRYDITPDEET